MNGCLVPGGPVQGKLYFKSSLACGNVRLGITVSKDLVAPSTAATTTDRAPSAAAAAVAARPGFHHGDLAGADADPAQPADDGRADVRGLLEEARPAGGAHHAVRVLRYVLDGLVLQQGHVVDLADDGDVGHVVSVHVGEETL